MPVPHMSSNNSSLYRSKLLSYRDYSIMEYIYTLIITITIYIYMCVCVVVLQSCSHRARRFMTRPPPRSPKSAPAARKTSARASRPRGRRLGGLPHQAKEAKLGEGVEIPEGFRVWDEGKCHGSKMGSWVGPNLLGILEFLQDHP